MKPTFKPRMAIGQLDPVEYTPVSIKVGNVVHKMALHLELIDTIPYEFREWHLSHVATGRKVLTVTCLLHGCGCSSRGIPVTAARKAAVANMAALVERVGADKINAKIAGALK